MTGRGDAILASIAHAGPAQGRSDFSTMPSEHVRLPKFATFFAKEVVYVGPRLDSRIFFGLLAFRAGMLLLPREGRPGLALAKL
jgi:hypothetical protein